MDNSTPGLGRGERAPDFVLPRQDGIPTRFYASAGGKPTVLVFCDAGSATGLRRFSEALWQAGGDDLAILAVQLGATDPPEPTLGALPFPVFSADAASRVGAAYRLRSAATPTCFVLDPNLRVLGSVALQDAATAAQCVASMVHANMPPVEIREITAQAPVLLIPNILDRPVCDFLMQVWENWGHVETGVEQSQAHRRTAIITPGVKSRRDHTVTDEKLLRLLTTSVGRRVIPEIRQAFAYVATRFEGFKIACYDGASGGFFRPHRDNLSPSTAHRRFALTLNINDGYEGGYLRFPEYGPHLYRPGPGDAIVFACALLHEVTALTRGRRFALLSFLFGEEGIRASSQKQPGVPQGPQRCEETQ